MNTGKMKLNIESFMDRRTSKLITICKWLIVINLLVLFYQILNGKGL